MTLHAKIGWISLLAALSLTLVSCGRLTRPGAGSSTVVVPLPKAECPRIPLSLTQEYCLHLVMPARNRDLRQDREDLLACMAEANKNARQIRELQSACPAPGP